MKYTRLGTISAPTVVLGCMRIADRPISQIDCLIHTALECGITMFDHADIYGKGRSEALFGEILKVQPGLRDGMILQSKCGIRPGSYDFTREHILTSAEQSLRRLNTDHLDLLLFHRPDALAEQEEFARAVRELKDSGKVLQFGVSNMNPAQITLLESWSGEPLVADQMQLSLMHADLVTSGMNVNTGNDQDSGSTLLPWCRRTGRTLQAWSPLQYGMFKGCFVGNEKFSELNTALDRLAPEYGVTPGALALAWILRIPGSIQVILGAADPGHVRGAAAAAHVDLSRQHWYELYRAAGGYLP